MTSPMVIDGALDLTLRGPGPGCNAELHSQPLGARLRALLRRVADHYPGELRAAQLEDVERIAFQLEQVYHPRASLVDLGAGIGIFVPTCAALGMDAYLVDDFRDAVNREYPLEDLSAHRQFGVRVVASDVRQWGEHFESTSLDIVTSFDSIEHWHHSPRRVFEEAYRVLKPGGKLMIGAPNAVNLRKRIAVFLGRSNWSHFEDWYYPDEFRGHVREPVLGDLLRMLDELGFEVQQVWGRNWRGYVGGRLRRLVTWLIDMPLRAVPTLCSDLYVMAVKPG